MEVEINECRKFISWAEKRITELDTEQEKEQVGLVEAQEWTSNPGAPRPPTFSRDTSDHVPVNGQFVAVRARCFGEGVDGSQDCRLGGTDHSPCCEETSRDAHGWIPLMPCHVPNDVTNWLGDRQADFQEALAHGDVRSLPELSRCCPTEPAIWWRCVHCRVLRRVTGTTSEDDEPLVQDTAKDSVRVSGSSRRRRPSVAMNDTESDRLVQTRQARRSQRSLTQVDASSDQEFLLRQSGRHVVPRTELPTTVLASLGGVVDLESPASFQFQCGR